LIPSIFKGGKKGWRHGSSGGALPSTGKARSSKPSTTKRKNKTKQKNKVGNFFL
jgi:hypothetical protein